MEYLVTMTTNVPDGTTEADIQDIRTREAGRSRELAAEGHLLRLWRPPLQPGEWRSLGLFAADGPGQLEDVLASMPLRVWRTDEPTPLASHPNDPAGQPTPAGRSAQHAGGTEFLTTFVISVPAGTPAEEADVVEAREADRARELASQGHLERLWRLAGEGHALGLWRAADAAGLQAILESLPQYDWMIVQTTTLTPHPNDPPLAGA
jgi:muconolactone delta-isomerase